MVSAYHRRDGRPRASKPAVRCDNDAQGGNAMKLDSRSIAVVLAAAALAVLAGPPAALAQSKPLKIGMPTSPPNIVHMPVYIAQDAGFFAAEGLKPEIIPFEDGTKGFRAMMSH